jgi:hypothetical protein
MPPVSKPTTTPGIEYAPEGDYEMTMVWNELVKIENGAKTFVKHVVGDIVHLLQADAERLLRAGAVKPTTEAQAESAAAQAPSPIDIANAVDAGREVPASMAGLGDSTEA